jgi:glutamate formiminotransferase / 5-formyltetrahydrofolate cyclo-ligase
MLLAVPNFSEGRDPARVERIRLAFTEGGAGVLDSHSDAVHNRTVLNLRAGSDAALADALRSGAAACVAEIDLRTHQGAHPCIGALDVCPVVFTDAAERQAARRLALAVAARIAEEAVPIFLYGELASAPERVERAHFRDGGLPALRRRMAAGELRPDLGPLEPHSTAGATLVTARPPLAAFNVILEGGGMEVARAIAADLREAGGGLAGVRALGIDLGDDRTQVSTNVHDPIGTPLWQVLERVRELALARGARPVAAELVGLVPEAALEGFPADVPIVGFDPAQQFLERRIDR